MSTNTSECTLVVQTVVILYEARKTRPWMAARLLMNVLRCNVSGTEKGTFIFMQVCSNVLVQFCKY